MRYRGLDADGDMQLGPKVPPVLVDSPDAVAQAVLTRLKLLTGEWFLDVTEGTPWLTDILGIRTDATRDRAIRRRILGTQGVNALLAYSSSLVDRVFTVTAKIDTIYGQANLTLTQPVISAFGTGRLDFSDPRNAVMNAAI